MTCWRGHQCVVNGVCGSAMAIMLMDEKNKPLSKSTIPRNDSYGHELSLEDQEVIEILNNDIPLDYSPNTYKY